MNFKKLLTFIICLAIPLLVGAISGFATSGQIETWFTTINKPTFNPPAWLFGPVWTFLYLLMGISLFQIWESPPSWPRQKSLAIFALQLFFNFWWSILFFHFHQIFISVLDICILWLLIVFMIGSFREVRPSAAYLNIPYLLWVSFATVLNIDIWKLN